MRKLLPFIALVFFFRANAQDSTMNSLLKDMDSKAPSGKPAVKIFDSEKLINTNTSELIGKGKMDFRVIHNFYDIGGKAGGGKNFFGLDNAADIRIGFEIGLGKKLDAVIARAKGAENYQNIYSRVSRILELGLKYKLMEQRKDDPTHPVSVLLYGNMAISTAALPNIAAVYKDSAESYFQKGSDRISNLYQLIVARKFGEVSVQVSGSVVHRNRVTPGDQQTISALGAAFRVPLTRSISLIVDYFHPFHNAASKALWKDPNSGFHPVWEFHDPLGIGFEFKTSGHIFHMNFTNATEILENRMLPRTVTSWGKGQFRWGFTVARTFSLWREKE